MSRTCVVTCAILVFTACLNLSSLALAQGKPAPAGAAKPEVQQADEAEPTSLKIEIADEPQTIDPSTLVFPPLAKKVTIEFNETSIREVVSWIRDENGVTVLLDEAALSDANILLSEPVSDRLNDDPLYLLLDRLSSLNLSWYVEDEILHITTAEAAGAHLTTVPHNVGSFFDAGFKADRLTETIMNGAGPGSWEEQGGVGSLVLLGDVMFIRQTDDIHREVAGLLAALSKHGRRTFIDDPPQHEALRSKLEEQVTVNFEDTPLAEAIAFLSDESGADIRIDAAAFRANRIRNREPVSLSLTNQKLSSVLHALLAKLRLTWTLRDCAILITTQETCDEFRKAAVFDVRDLCRNFEEADGLKDALMTQTQGDWEENGGRGVIVFAKPGVMVVGQTERGLGEVLQLIENYRAALKVSKVRDREKVDPKEPLTRYYRVPTPMAKDLQSSLALLVAPTSWRTAEKPDALGTIVMVATRPSLLEAKAGVLQQTITEGVELANGLVIENSVLIVHQTRENHEKIAKLMTEIEYGTPAAMGVGGGMGGGGLGGGGGGFGGGFFSLPNRHDSLDKHLSE